MTDQTPAPMTTEKLDTIRQHVRAYALDPSDAPILVEAATDRRALLAEVDRLRAALDRSHTESLNLGVSLAETIHERQQLRTRLADAEQTRRAALAVAADLTEDLAEARAHKPATATGAPDPDPSEGPAPTGLPGAAQGPAPLTLAQAATSLHDWAGDLADGARTDWPAGHPDIIRGIRAAADWLDARATYETETREQMRALVDRHGMADRTCLIGDDTRTPDAAVDAVVTILDRVVSGHLDDRDREGEDWSGPHPISIESDARRIIAAVQPHLIATAREAEEAPEPAEPTWRDVIRAMRAENIRLRPLYDIANWPADRTWQLIDHHGNELGIVTHETSYAGEEWTLALGYERGPSTRIGAEALEPTDVLAAARLAGLIGDTDA